MESADLREELNCSICLSVYTDPVMLRCGHNYCRVCIRRVLDTQKGSGVYTCPECRAQFRKRPALQRNVKLCNIVEHFLSTHQDQEETGISCTYCVHSPVPAVKTCLQCEASLCHIHLRVHNKSAEHELTEPTTSLENRKCPIHKELLKYYCPEDGTCICVSCCLAGEHKGHQVELLNEASEKKKETFRDVLEKLNSKREEAEKRVQSLKERRREVREKIADVTHIVTALIWDIREQLEALEEEILSEISRQEEQDSLQVSGLIQQLEIKKDELSRKIRHIEELCNKTDPISVLREDQEYTDTCDMDSDGDNDECIQLDEAPISLILHRGLVHLSDVLIDLKLRPFPILETSDISLDMKTADNYIIVSSDLKSATYTSTYQRRPDGPERFKSKQVQTISNFSSGRHYWEVDVSKADKWLIGAAYPSIERKIAGNESFIGFNDKSWALIFNPHLAKFHNDIQNSFYLDSPVRSVGIYLNYEAGRLSFYQLCDPVRHLHSFTATFTEPLHAAFCVFPFTSIRIRD
ncbi:E3 ubiquitin/ISG15 ligase TRIM25-like [Rhinophrynus dorsalis]